MTDLPANTPGTPEKPGEKGLIESGLSELGQKVQVMKHVWDEMGNLYDDFNKMTLTETWDRFKGIFAMGFLGMLMSKEEFEKWKNEKEEVVVIDENPMNRNTNNAEEIIQDHEHNSNILKLLPKNKHVVDQFKETFEKNKARYEKVSQATGIPPLLIAAMHRQEGSMNFNTYLHNGQKLGHLTTIQPKDILFYDWEEAAIHALGGYKDGRQCKDANGKVHQDYLDYFKRIRTKLGLTEKSANIGAMMTFAEYFNGIGARTKQGKMSSYIYAGTNLSTPGRYTADRKFDKNAVSQGVGVAALLLGVTEGIELAENDHDLYFEEEQEALPYKNNRVLKYPISNEALSYIKEYNPHEEKIKPTLAKREKILVRKTIKKALDEANKLAAREGYQIIVGSGYRTIAEQRYLKELERKNHGDRGNKWVGDPGKSWHHSGGAVDIGLYKIGDTKRLTAAGKKEMSVASFKPYNDLLEKYMNAAGFVRLHNEAWHFEIGTIYWVDHMQKKGILPKKDARLLAYAREGNEEDEAYQKSLTQAKTSSEIAVSFTPQENKNQDEKSKQTSEKTTNKNAERIDKNPIDKGLGEFIDEELKSKEGARFWAKNLEGNGDRSVLTYVPPGVDLKANNLIFIYQFHGTFSEQVTKPYEGLDDRKKGWSRLQDTISATDKLAKKGKNVVLVYPLSGGPRNNTNYDNEWMATGKKINDGNTVTDNFDQLHGQVIEEIGIQSNQISRIEVQGNSSGGKALLNIAQSGTKLVNAYRFLDASFKGWAEACYAASRKHGAPDLYLIIANTTVPTFPKNMHKKSEWGKKGLLEKGSKGPYSTKIEGIYFYQSELEHGEMVKNFTGWRPEDHEKA